jgi:hypothetical protein
MNAGVLSYAWRPNLYQRHRKKTKAQKRELIQNRRILQRQSFDQRIWSQIHKLSPSKIVVATQRVPFKNHSQMSFLPQLPKDIQKRIRRKFPHEFFYLVNRHQYQNIYKLDNVTVSNLRFYSVNIPVLSQNKKRNIEKDIRTVKTEEVSLQNQNKRDIKTTPVTLPLGTDITNVIRSRATDINITSRVHQGNVQSRSQSVVVNNANNTEEQVTPNTGDLILQQSIELSSPQVNTEDVRSEPESIQTTNLSHSQSNAEIRGRGANRRQILLLLFILLMALLSRRPIPSTRATPVTQSLENDQQNDSQIDSEIDFTQVFTDFCIPSNKSIVIPLGKTLRVANSIKIAGVLNIAGTLEII